MDAPILAADLLRVGGSLPVVVFWVSVGLWAAGERFIGFLSWRTRHARLGARRADAGSVVVVVVGIVGGLLAGLNAARARLAPVPAPQVWFVVGIVIALAGILLRWWSVRTLGAYFSPVVTVADDQPLVSAGPYRWVRHPSYTGLLLTFVGFGAALGDVAALSVMVGVLAAALTYRIRVEERALGAAFGARWETFAAGRARLIPGIW